MSDILPEGLRLAAVGITTVFCALIIIGLVVGLIGRFSRTKPPKPAAAAPPLPETSFAGIDKHTLVLLAAAATVAVKRPVRIRRVRFVSHRHIPAFWAAVGRAGQAENPKL